MASNKYTLMAIIILLVTTVCTADKSTFASSALDNDLILADDYAIRNQNDRTFHPRRHRHRHHPLHSQPSDNLLNSDDESTDDIVFQTRYKNFLLTDYLADGEMEQRINFDGITAKQTSISTST